MLLLISVVPMHSGLPTSHPPTCTSRWRAPTLATRLQRAETWSEGKRMKQMQEPEAELLPNFCFHWLCGTKTMSHALISWQWDCISNSSRCSRQEQPPHQTSASKSLGPPLGSLNAFRDIWTHTFHLLTPTILLHMFILLWTPSKLESVERCFYGLRF